MITDQKLLSIDPKDYHIRSLSAEEILEWFDACDAGWMHDGDSKKPHAELVSGKCSNGYFNCSKVLCYPNLCEILAHQLVRKFIGDRIAVCKFDWVVSSSYAAITFGHEVAKVLGAKFGFTEKDPNNPKGQIWKRFAIPKGSKVLQAEELITTSGTFEEVYRAVKEGNSESVIFSSDVFTLIHRPSKLSTADYDNRRVRALVHEEIWAVKPEDCPLCAKGSKPLRPKENWAKLTGKA